MRGLLWLENVSYGIEPLESSATYEHIVYQIKDKKIDFSPIAENYSTTQLTDKSYKSFVKSEVVTPFMGYSFMQLVVIIFS